MSASILILIANYIVTALFSGEWRMGGSDSMITPKIILEGMTKSFGDKQVLQGIDLEVAPEESLAIIGTSGCGKSVTLKCLLGLIRADGGSIRVDGEEMINAGRRQLEMMRRRFGMTFQFGALFDSLPIWENVTFRLRQQQTMTRQQARDVAAETITQLGLASHVIDQFPAELSGGMQKRVALARAIADKPEILLFDEPTSGLDPITGGVIDGLIIDSVRRLGATAVTISHDMASVRRSPTRWRWCITVSLSGAVRRPKWTRRDRGSAPVRPWTCRRAAYAGRAGGSAARLMAKTSVSYICQQCGGAHRKWSGRCDRCGAWNTLVEERVEAPSGPGRKASGRRVEMQPLATSGDVTPPPRMKTGMAEFDRVAGGGLVAGSATLIGGDPGIGKSTLLLQLVCRLAADGRRTAYISGEESAEQVRMRARRLGLGSAAVDLATSTNAADIAASIGGRDGPEVVVIDSIQTMFLPTLDSAPGTVSQVRATAQELIRAAKTNDVALLVVGHVTKDGAIAGPRVLEHMVDTVLYFEGDRSHHFRILRGVKNRFGATDEIGVFEMAEKGLVEVPNPRNFFLLTGATRSRARLSSPASREAAQFLSKSRRLSPPRRSPHRAAMSSAGTAADLPCLPPCLRRDAVCRYQAGTSS